jgi:hypothetical protein
MKLKEVPKKLSRLAETVAFGDRKHVGCWHFYVIKHLVLSSCFFWKVDRGGGDTPPDSLMPLTARMIEFTYFYIVGFTLP